MSLRAAVLLSGTGSNFQSILNRVSSGSLDVELAAALSDRPGRAGPSCGRARRASRLPAWRLADFADKRSWWDAFAGRLRSFAPDVVVLAGFMRILPGFLCDEYRGRALNIHPSLLPRYRGLHTYRASA